MTSQSPVRTTINSYNKTVHNYHARTKKLHLTATAKQFTSSLQPGARILDLGCGPGRDAKIFSHEGFTVVGIDLSKEMIRAARQLATTAMFRIMDMRKLSFRANTFDGIWSCASLLHLPKKDLPRALAEARRVLKTGGIFSLCVKKGKGEAMLPDARYNGAPKFWSFFSKAELHSFIKKAGLTIVNCFIDTPTHGYATNPWICVFCKK